MYIQQTVISQKISALLDESDNVRLSVRKNLWNAKNDFPDVIKVISLVAEGDRSEEVRKASVMILKSNQVKKAS